MSLAESSVFANLIAQLRGLPGVGERTAIRMALHMLARERDAMRSLGRALHVAADKLGQCHQCRGLSEFALCHICSDTARQGQPLCVVQSDADIMAMESSGAFGGFYFVLHGLLSPLDAIGAEELGLPQLVRLCTREDIREVVLACPTSVEGDATAIAIYDRLAPLSVAVSKLATGLPLGGELRHLDPGTIGHALAGRVAVDDA